MIDVYMAVSLAAIFGLFYGFTCWCGRVVDNQGGEGQ
ncbi:MAG: hypothetical protein K0R57_5530 [Paenibacillaceae bacterium]|jgi:hypothetical protein|nr:hypothetical protein [Paenibacillaceae bacterium]